MMPFDHLGLLRRVDRLYEDVVTDAAQWSDEAFADWAAEATAGTVPTRPVARAIRASLRMAKRLQAFWSEDASRPDDHGDWRSRVDLALGARAWRPTLDIARAGLDEAPSEELFAEVQRRFRVVNSNRWMEEISFAEWLAEHGPVGRAADRPEQ